MSGAHRSGAAPVRRWRAGLRLGAATLALGCGGSYREVARVRSPDGVVDAVVVRGKPSPLGATTPEGFFLYLVPRGAAAPDDDAAAVFRGVETYDMRPEWRAPRLLAVRYGVATITHFQNVWYPPDALGDGTYVVELRLAPDSAPWSLSPRTRRVGLPDG